MNEMAMRLVEAGAREEAVRAAAPRRAGLLKRIGQALLAVADGDNRTAFPFTEGFEMPVSGYGEARACLKSGAAGERRKALQ